MINSLLHADSSEQGLLHFAPNYRWDILYLRLTAESFFGDSTGIPGLLRAGQRCKPLLQPLRLMVRDCTRDGIGGDRAGVLKALPFSS